MKILRVPEDYPTIQDAAYIAREGDTILLAPGKYDEIVVLKKSVNLEGASYEDKPTLKYGIKIVGGGGVVKNVRIDTSSPKIVAVFEGKLPFLLKVEDNYRFVNHDGIDLGFTQDKKQVSVPAPEVPYQKAEDVLPRSIFHIEVVRESDIVLSLFEAGKEETAERIFERMAEQKRLQEFVDDCMYRAYRALNKFLLTYRDVTGDVRRNRLVTEADFRDGLVIALTDGKHKVGHLATYIEKFESGTVTPDKHVEIQHQLLSRDVDITKFLINNAKEFMIRGDLKQAMFEVGSALEIFIDRFLTDNSRDFTFDDYGTYFKFKNKKKAEVVFTLDKYSRVLRDVKGKSLKTENAGLWNRLKYVKNVRNQIAHKGKCVYVEQEKDWKDRQKSDPKAKRIVEEVDSKEKVAELIGDAEKIVVIQ
jgi:hypothetical protein